MSWTDTSLATWNDIMLPLLGFWAVTSRIPFVYGGDTLHRAALLAVFERRFEIAERLFEAAALRYRRHLDVPRLARLRVHQLIGRAQACRFDDRDAALELAAEIERRLAGLDDLEDLTPPFALVPTATVDAHWRVAEEPAPVAVAA